MKPSVVGDFLFAVEVAEVATLNNHASHVLQQVLTFRFVISLNPISLVYRIALCLLRFDVPLFSVLLARLALY